MIRLAALLVLAAASGAAASDNDTIAVSLDARGRGDVYMIFHARIEAPDRIAAIEDPRVKSVLFVRMLRASPADITAFLSRASFGGVAVTQHVDGTDIRTEVTASISDLRPLGTLVGGELKYDKMPDNMYRLEGTFGGELARASADLSALAGTRVTLRFAFPGTVRSTKTGERSHSADSVTWRFTGDRLLAQPRALDAVVLPRIEGDPKYWLALILGVTTLVVVGAIIVLRRGREARV